jgi:hypothetical protein
MASKSWPVQSRPAPRNPIDNQAVPSDFKASSSNPEFSRMIVGAA